MEENQRGEVTFEYKVSPNYNLYAVNGIQGGFNARGELVVNFFFESTPIPKSITHEIREDHGLGKETSRESAEAVIRHVPFGIAMDPRYARYLAKWFTDRADEFESIIRNVQNE